MSLLYRDLAVAILGVKYLLDPKRPRVVERKEKYPRSESQHLVTLVKYPHREERHQFKKSLLVSNPNCIKVQLGESGFPFSFWYGRSHAAS